MQWLELYEVFLKKRDEFWWWLVSQLAGIILALLASFTIYIFHHKLVDLPPEPQILLVTGVISVAMTGISYFSSRPEIPESLSRWLLVTWALLVALVYGVIVAVGVQQPRLSYAWIWMIAFSLLLASLAWSSVMWLHLEGLRMQSSEEEIEEPKVPPDKALDETADMLSKELPTAGQ